MRAVVLGANGQDGSYLAEALLDRGFEVFGLGRTAASPYGAGRSGYRYVELDLTDHERLAGFLRDVRPTHCFHFAAVHGAVGEGFTYEARWEAMMHVNTLALHAALETARVHLPTMRIFYAGSAKIFPAPWRGVIDEQTSARPTCLYSIGKIASRDLIGHYRQSHGVRGTNLILFNHDSRRRSTQYLLPKIAETIANAKRDPVASTQVRTLNFWIDWGHARDFMEIVAELATADDVNELVMATGVTVHARTVIKAAFERHGLAMERHVAEEFLGGSAGPEFRVDISRLVSCARAPRIQVDELIDDLIGGFESAR